MNGTPGKKSKLTYSRIVSTLALFVALGGSAYAISANSIKSRHIADNTIRSIDLRDGGIRGHDVGGNALGGAAIDEGTLGTVPNADRVDGVDAGSFQNAAATGDGAEALFESGPLTVRTKCESLSNATTVYLLVSTDQAARIGGFGSTLGEPDVYSVGVLNMNPGGELALITESSPASYSTAAQFTYSAGPTLLARGHVVSVDAVLTRNGDKCFVAGTWLSHSFGRARPR